MSVLRIEMLGALQVRVGENAISFRTDAQRVLLAYLAAQQGKAQRRDTLAGLLAPDRPNKAALTYLRNRLTRLRQAIGDDATNPPYLTIDRKQIELRIANHVWVDVSQFARLTREVATHNHRQLAGCLPCLERLEEAVGLVRGEFLAGLNFPSETWEAWLLAQREHYRQQALEAMTLLREANVVRGAWADVLDVAQRQLTLEPWLEPAHRAIMQTHYQLGDRNAALAQYEQCEKLLYEELDVDPEPATLELYAMIKDEGERMNSSFLQPVVALHPSALPTPTGAFFGRSPQQSHLLNLLVNPTHRLITIVGTGGIGKTRLAIEIGRKVGLNFPDGVWFVALDAVQGGAEQIKIGIGEAAHLGQAERQLTEEQVIAILRDKQLLLILDNCETVLEDLAFLPQWLQRAPNIAILATSREPLNFQAESLISLDGLPMETAIDLFAERGQMARADFEVTEENRPHIQQVCELVDGSPLGIALAAAWVRRRSLQQIVASIGQSLDFLTTRMRDIDPRHRSMRAVFETSWQLLTGAEQAILAALSVFPASFSADAAQAIANATLLDLDVLCEKSLLQQDQESERYSLHGLVRGFSADKISDPNAINDKFANYFYQIAQTHQNDYAQLQPEWRNFSAAIEQAHHLEAWQLVLDFVRVVDEARLRQMRFGEMRDGLTLAIDAANGLGDQAAMAWVLLRLGEIEMELNAYPSAEKLINNARQIYMRFEDSGNIASATYFKARIQLELAQHDEVRELALDSQRIFQEEGDALGVAKNLNLLALCEIQQHENYQEARRLLEKSAELQRPHPTTANLMETLRYLGRADMMLNEFVNAETHLLEAIALSQQQNNLGEFAAATYERMLICKRQERFDQALELGYQCLDSFKTVGSLRWQALVKTQLGLMHQAKAQLPLGRALLEQGIEIFYELGDKQEEAYSQYYLGMLLRELGEMARSVQALQRAATLNAELKLSLLTKWLAAAA